MYDLIYADKEAEDIMLRGYPEAKVANASDDIHTERFSFEVPDDGFELSEYYRFMIVEGLALVSLNMSIAMKMPGEQHDLIMAEVAKLSKDKKAPPE